MSVIEATSGYVASMLVLLTFMTKDMRHLRMIALLSNIAFIAYGALSWLPPVLLLHLALLPINIVRLQGLRQDEGEGLGSICPGARTLHHG